METKTGYVTIGDGKLYYEMAGEGDTVVFSHAGFVDSRMWNGQWDVFAQHYRVVRFDMRGFGKSDPVRGPIARREDLYALLKQLGVKQAALIGCSLSGEVILDFALEHPEMVSALVPVSAVPGGFEMQGEPPPFLMEMMTAAQQGDLDRASELQNRIWVDGMFRQPNQVDPAVRQLAGEMNRIALQNGTFAKAEMTPHNPLTPPAVTRLKEIGVPTLIIDGGLDHPEILRAAEVMATTMPNAQKVILADCAHVPNMEKAAAFNEAVMEFLRGVV